MNLNLREASSVSRMYQQFQEGTFAALTAYTDDGEKRDPEWDKKIKEKDENFAYHVNLGKDLNAIGLAFVHIDGRWYDDDKVLQAEPAFWIPNISREQAEALSAKYNQYSYIWGEKGQWFEFPTGSDIPRNKGNKFSASVIDDLEENYSEYKKKPVRLTDDESDFWRQQDLKNLNMRPEKENNSDVIDDGSEDHLPA